MSSITVVIPTYNRVNTLCRALDSAIQQSRQPNEIIVIDDASTDNTINTLRNYSAVTYFRNTNNIGAAASRNVGIEKSKGDYIAFLDSDDEWHKEKLSRQYDYLESHPEIDLVCTGVKVYFNELSSITYSINENQSIGKWTFDDFFNYPFSPSTWLIRRNALISVKSFDVTLANCEDIDILAKLNSVSGIAVINEPLTTKYNQPDSLDANLERRTKSIDTLFERHKELWAKSKRTAALTCLSLASRYFDNGHNKKGREYLLKAWDFRPLDIKIATRIILSSLLGNQYRLIMAKWKQFRKYFKPSAFD